MGEQVLTVIQETVILGKRIQMYGSIENSLFLAKDVAEWIDYSKSNGKYKVSQMVKTIDDDEKGIYNVATLRGVQKCIFLTEDGLYEVCMQSRKPIAKQMKKEIKKYLKSIRLTGAAIDDERKTVDYYFSSFSDDLKTKIFNEMYQKNQELQQFYDDLMNTEGLMSINTMAKELGIGEYKLFAFLRKKKVFSMIRIWLMCLMNGLEKKVNLLLRKLHAMMGIFVVLHMERKQDLIIQENC